MAKELFEVQHAATAAVAENPREGVSQSGRGTVISQVLTPETAAEYLHVTVEVVIAEAEAGRLPGRKLGGDWRFHKRSIRDWLAGSDRLSVAGGSNPSPQVTTNVVNGNLKLLRGKDTITIPQDWTPEYQAEVEAEISNLYAARRAVGTVGEVSE
jgi:excisionase family DNA binding protein